MKFLFPLAVALFSVTTCAQAADDPCANYHTALAYSRTADATPVTLSMIADKTGAEIEFRVPKNYTGNHGNLTSGRQCMIALEMSWPQMSAGGLLSDNERRVRDRMIGDVPAWRTLTIDVSIDHAPWEPWMTAAGYCGDRQRRAERDERPFGLRAFDDGIRWPSHRQADGSYRTMQELVSAPLREANRFYYVDDPDTEQMVDIHCSKGAPRCRLHGHFQGFRTTTFFNAEDLENWRNYRDAVRDFLNKHLVRSKPAQAMLDPGRHINPPSELVACMKDMQTKGSIDAATLERMGLDR
jgi:hypothetical protein